MRCSRFDSLLSNDSNAHASNSVSNRKFTITIFRRTLSRFLQPEGLRQGHSSGKFTIKQLGLQEPWFVITHTIWTTQEDTVFISDRDRNGGQCSVYRSDVSRDSPHRQWKPERMTEWKKWMTERMKEWQKFTITQLKPGHWESRTKLNKCVQYWWISFTFFWPCKQNGFPAKALPILDSGCNFLHRFLYYTLYMVSRQCKGIDWEGCVMWGLTYYYPGQKKNHHRDSRREERCSTCDIMLDQARSGAISAGQVRSATVRDFCPALIAPDQAWYHTWNSVLLAANLEDSSFFLSRVVVCLHTQYCMDIGMWVRIMQHRF